MTDDPVTPFEPTAPAALLNLPEGERLRLGEALRELLACGSISGIDPSRAALYHWCRQYFDWLKEAAALAGLEVALMHEERLVQAVPQVAALRLKLRQDATLIWLALWYAGDVRWRDEGQDQAFLSVAELVGLIQDQLLPDAVGQIPRGRLREILRQAERFNLIRFEMAEPFEESGIEILPAIRRIIPFRELAAWTEAASAFRQQDPTTIEIVEEAAAAEEVLP
jgi:hypothetical protein